MSSAGNQVVSTKNVQVEEDKAGRTYREKSISDRGGQQVRNFELGLLSNYGAQN